jgi:hypothetical protein
MDAAMYQNLPELTRGGKHAISELHVFLCEPSKPAVVCVNQCYKSLPIGLRGVAELVARAAQTLEIEQPAPCGIYQFLVELLAQVIDSTGVLQQAREERCGEVLAFMLTKRQPLIPKLLAIADGTVDVAQSKVKQGKGRKRLPEAWQLATMD